MIAGFPPPEHPEPYVTMRELAEIMGVSVSTVKRWVADGMPSETWGARVRRFRPSAAMAWRSAIRIGER